MSVDKILFILYNYFLTLIILFVKINNDSNSGEINANRANRS